MIDRRAERPTWWLARLFLALVLGLLGTASSIPGQQAEWIRADSPSFTVFSNTGAKKTREIVLGFERLRSTLMLLRPDLEHESPVPTSIYVFRSERDYAPFKQMIGDDTRHVRGHFLSRPWGHFIAFNANPKRGSSLPVAYHEYVHSFLTSNFPRLPLWFNEGLAEYYSTFEWTPKTAKVGLPREDHLRFLHRNSMMPLEDLFSVTSNSRGYRDGDYAGELYAQSWLLVHYLLSEGGETADAAGRFLVAFANGEPMAAAFVDAFGMRLGELEEVLVDYANRSQFDALRITSERIGALPDVRVRRMDDDEVDYRLGLLHAFSGESSQRESLEPLHRAGATVPDALAILAWVYQERGDLDGALDLYRTAISRDANEALSYVLCGDFLLKADRGELPLADPPAVSQARAILERALALDPDFTEARVLLGMSYLQDDPEASGAERGIELLLEAFRRLPGRMDIAYNLAMLYVETGDLASADRIVEHVLAPVGRDDLAARGREEIVRTRLVTKANEAIEAGRFDEARDLVVEALLETSDSAHRQSLSDWIGRLEAGMVTQSEIERYNRAVDLLNVGQAIEAREALETLLDEATDAQVRLWAAEALRSLGG